MYLEDPTKGRSAEWWLLAYQKRNNRLRMFIELNAPPSVVSGDIKLLKDALNALEAFYGEPTPLLVVS